MPGSVQTEDAGRELYQQVYAAHDERNQRWKALLASYNIEPLEAMLDLAGVRPERVLDVGCGDGAILAELSRHGIGRRFVAYEIAPAAVDYVASRNIPGVEAVRLFDGYRLPEPDDSFGLGLLHFVIDQTPHPGQLLGEVRRVSRYVFVSVMLDDTLRTQVSLRRGGTGRFGRVQMYNRESAREQLRDAGLRILLDSVDLPPARLAMFWADDAQARARAFALGQARRAVHAVAPRVAERLVGHAYRAVCERV